MNEKYESVKREIDDMFITREIDKFLNKVDDKDKIDRLIDETEKKNKNEVKENKLKNTTDNSNSEDELFEIVSPSKIQPDSRIIKNPKKIKRDILNLETTKNNDVKDKNILDQTSSKHDKSFGHPVTSFSHHIRIRSSEEWRGLINTHNKEKLEKKIGSSEDFRFKDSNKEKGIVIKKEMKESIGNEVKEEKTSDDLRCQVVIGKSSKGEIFKPPNSPFTHIVSLGKGSKEEIFELPKQSRNKIFELYEKPVKGQHGKTARINWKKELNLS